MKEEIVERIERTLEKIREIASEGTPILVEGKKDEEVLRVLGVEGRIIKVSQQSLNTLIDQLYGCKRVLILTDFDEKGEKIAKNLSSLLEIEGTIPLHEMRNELKHALAGQVSCIEGIRKTLLRLNRRDLTFGGVKFGRKK
ncbi:MAG: toprim domain-containing protein [Candidatus Baldrarchaeia archaeon]